MLTSADLQRYINTHQINATILPMTEHTPTVSDTARVLGVTPQQIIKSLVFVVKGEPLLVISNGLTRVERRKIATHIGVSRKQIKFANAEQVLTVTGFVVGSMPPFGHRQALPTIVDPAITELDVIFGGGGDIDAMLRLTPTELLRVTKAEITDVAEDTDV